MIPEEKNADVVLCDWHLKQSKSETSRKSPVPPAVPGVSREGPEL